MNEVGNGVAVAVITGCAIVGLAATSQSQLADAEQQIRAVVEDYVLGVAEADPERLARAWAIGAAHMKYVVEGSEDQLEVLPITDAISGWTRSADPDARARILSIDIVDNRMAAVKLEFRWMGRTYIDYLSLYRLGGNWKLVNKVFVALQ